MEGVLLLILVLVGLALFDIAVDCWGADSRYGAQDIRGPVTPAIR